MQEGNLTLFVVKFITSSNFSDISVRDLFTILMRQEFGSIVPRRVRVENIFFPKISLFPFWLCGKEVKVYWVNIHLWCAVLTV